MSMETSTWLNRMTLIGFTEKRGNAWHYRESSQGVEPNHYTFAIPVEDVRRRLFNWQPVEGTVETVVLNNNGVLRLKDAERKTIVRLPLTFGPDDEGSILGIFKDGYLIHGYEEWLLDSVATILDDNLQIGSAGLLKGGAVAWVSIEVPENITTPEGVVFRPNLLAATSLDGSLSTTYQRVVTNVVCDNTMSAALNEGSGKGDDRQRIKVKHSRYSQLKLHDAREALAIVHTIADDFSREVAELTNTTVTDAQWQKFMEEIAPTVDPKGNAKEGRGLTLAQNKQATLNKLWLHDNRVAPWTGTAWGVVQAVNTFDHHEGTVRGSSRPERNMLRAVSGGIDKLDGDTLTTLRKVLA